MSEIQAESFRIAGFETSKRSSMGWKGDTYGDGLVVLGENFPPEQSGHERCHSLLAVDQDALASKTREPSLSRTDGFCQAMR